MAHPDQDKIDAAKKAHDEQIAKRKEAMQKSMAAALAERKRS